MNDNSDKVYKFEQVVYEMKTEGQISEELMQIYVTWSRLCKDSLAKWENENE
jgi:hypothetical protein